MSVKGNKTKTKTKCPTCQKMFVNLSRHVCKVKPPAKKKPATTRKFRVTVEEAEFLKSNRRFIQTIIRTGKADKNVENQLLKAERLYIQSILSKTTSNKSAKK